MAATATRATTVKRERCGRGNWFMSEGFLPRNATPIEAALGRSDVRAMIPASNRGPEDAPHDPPGATARRAFRRRANLRHRSPEAHAANGPRPLRLAARSAAARSGWPSRRGRSGADLPPPGAARSMPRGCRDGGAANRRSSPSLPASGRAARTLRGSWNRGAPSVRPHRRDELGRGDQALRRDRIDDRVAARRSPRGAAPAAHAARRRSLGDRGGVRNLNGGGDDRRRATGGSPALDAVAGLPPRHVQADSSRRRSSVRQGPWDRSDRPSSGVGDPRPDVLPTMLKRTDGVAQESLPRCTLS